MKKQSLKIMSRVEIIQSLKQTKQSLDAFLTSNNKNAKSEELGALRNRVLAMVREKQINVVEELLSPSFDIRVGILKKHPDGFGFVSITGENSNWFVPASFLKSYLGGEKIMVQPLYDDNRGINARVIGQLEPRKDVTGYLSPGDTPDHFFISLNASGAKLPIELSLDSLQLSGPAWVVGDFVELPQRYEKHKFCVRGIIEKPNLAKSISTFEIQAAGFNLSPSDECNNEAMINCVNTPTNAGTFLDEAFISVDGAFSRDLDDLVFATKSEDGFNLKVAIADVSRFVPVGSKVDNYAKKQMTSIYCPGFTSTMLPSIISHDICSLLPGPIKNTLVADINLDKDGRVLNYHFLEAETRSSQKFTYNRVQELKEGALPTLRELPSLATLEVLFDIEKLREKIQEDNGELKVYKDEFKPHFDEDDDIDCFFVCKTNKAHSMIKEMMVLANICAADFLNKEFGYAMYRHHPKIKGSDLKIINDFLKSHSLPLLDSQSSTKDYLKSKENLPNDESKEQYQVLLVNSMNKASYSATESSHFSMGLPYYVHFTSPIRRYADLVTHRMIKFALNKNGGNCHGAHFYSLEEIHKLSNEATNKTSESSHIESKVLNKLACLLLSKHDRTKPLKVQYTGQKDTSFFFSLENSPLTIMIKNSKMNYSESALKNTTEVMLIEVNYKQGKVNVEPVVPAPI